MSQTCAALRSRFKVILTGTPVITAVATTLSTMYTVHSIPYTPYCIHYTDRSIHDTIIMYASYISYRSRITYMRAGKNYDRL